MQFIDNAPVYKLVRVTGPTHNLLVLKLSSTPTQGDVTVERLDSDKECLNPIRADEVRAEVVRALNDHHGERGGGRFIELIQYLGSDRRPAGTYYMMAREILKKAEETAAG